MNQEMTLAQTPHEVSALRARIFLDGADEIARIDVVNKKELIVGRIGVVLDAIQKALGKSEREFDRSDERIRSLLKDACEETFDVKIRNTAHLFNVLKSNLCQEREIYGLKAGQRDQIQRFLRRVAAKLVNGHAGVFI
jgi:hypothetical protein